MSLSPLAEKFYQRSVLEVARDLLGTRLIRKMDGQEIGGYIIETEAYQGEQDLACHARAGRTKRTEVMYGPPGRAYIYFIYGMHWMLNVVTEPDGIPGAVLIRALLPERGIEVIAERREGVRPKDWTNGPARLCQALAIDSQWNGTNLTLPESDLVICAGQDIEEEAVQIGPRVGIDRVPEPWKSKPWRFQVDLQSWNPPPGQNGV